MKFYSVKLRKNIEIPASRIKTVTKIVNGRKRKFAVGTYSVGSKKYEAWRVMG